MQDNNNPHILNYTNKRYNHDSKDKKQDKRIESERLPQSDGYYRLS